MNIIVDCGILCIGSLYLSFKKSNCLISVHTHNLSWKQLKIHHMLQCLSFFREGRRYFLSAMGCSSSPRTVWHWWEVRGENEREYCKTETARAFSVTESNFSTSSCTYCLRIWEKKKNYQLKTVLCKVISNWCRKCLRCCKATEKETW